jgi:malate dehydrogenase (oxaloacetate-decarboxylating)(NADP+)
MLSFSNFGSVHHSHARRVREAVEIARSLAPELEIEGEMQLSTARNESLRGDVFPFARLTGDANVLIFPDLQSGNLAMQALSYMAEAIPIGPLLMGTRLPAHVLQHGASVEDVVNLVTVGVVEGLVGG